MFMGTRGQRLWSPATKGEAASKEQVAIVEREKTSPNYMSELN